MIESDFRISSILYWTDKDQFDKRPLAENEKYDLVGFMFSNKPKVGQTVCGEFYRSWVQFEFTEVSPCYDPPDMFFAKVKPINQKQK